MEEKPLHSCLTSSKDEFVLQLLAVSESPLTAVVANPSHSE